jgi:hypothetical protein
MGCCGQRRAQMTTGGTVQAEANRSRPVSRVALYEYTGMTAMTVAGPVSGSKYRFAAPGAKVQVALRDVASMSSLPNLRRLE